MSADGFIATRNDETPWSDVSWVHYNTFVKKHGNIILGRRTYDLMCSDGTFDNMGSPFTVILSHQRLESVATATSAKEAVRLITKKGFEAAVVGGAAATNGSFLKEGLLDELYLDIDPTILGEGLPLFAGAGEHQCKLELLESKEEGGVIQLHYKIKK